MKVEVLCDDVKPDVDATTTNNGEDERLGVRGGGGGGAATTKDSATRNEGFSGDARPPDRIGAASPNGSDDSDIICEDEAFAPVAFPAFSVPSNAVMIRREVGGGSPVSEKDLKRGY